MNKPNFVYVTYIATTPEKLWQALTDGDFSEKYWMGCRAESNWQVGSPVVYTMPKENATAFTGEVLECDPPRRLSYTFNDVYGGFNEPASRVVFDIEDRESMVKLTVTHDGFAPDSKLFTGISNGWPGILSSLKTLLESGKELAADPAQFRCKQYAE